MRASDVAEKELRGARSWERLMVLAVDIAPLLPVLAGLALLFVHKGVGHYSPPDCGGIEPALNHFAALEILRSGRTAMTFHATGYSYFVAFVYLFFPNTPVSVLGVQMALSPIVVLMTGRLVGRLCGAIHEPTGRIAAGLYYPFAYYSVAFSTIVPPLTFVTAFSLVSLRLFDESPPKASSWLGGLFLGLAVCHRPNLAPLGVFLFVGLLVAKRNFVAAVQRTFPVALVSLGLLGIMTYVNPPLGGQLLRGSQGFSRGILQGTYQYAHRWWDWEWIEDPRDPGQQEYERRLKEIETEVGKKYPDPALEKPLRAEAWRRMVTLPCNTARKILISLIRIWIAIPTHSSSMALKVVIAVLEFAVLLAAVLGVFTARTSGGIRVFLIGSLLTPCALHAFVTVEPRYSLPVRALYLAFAVVGAVSVAKLIRARGCRAG